MHLHSVTMVRDEADVVEAFVRHTLLFVDTMHVVVHQSIDATASILQRLRDEGLPVRVTVSDDPVFRQGATLTGLARVAFGLGAQFVLVLDADEFVVAASRSALEGKLAGLPADTAGAMPWRTYIPLPGDPAGEAHVLRRITHRPMQERKMLGKIVLGPAFARDESLCLLEGSHWLYRRAQDEHVAQPMQVFGDVSLAHFPVRSVEQAIAKMLQRRWQRRIAWVDEPISRLVASGWRSTFERMTEIVLERGTLTSEELAWFAYDYSGPYDAGPVPALETYRQSLVRDPCGGASSSLRYASDAGTPLAGLYRWVDGLLRSARA